MTPTAPVASDNKAPAGTPAALVPPDEKFWQRYSPHHEFPLSSVTSITLHILAIGLLAFAAWIAIKLGLTDDASPPDVAIVSVQGLTGGGGTPGGQGDSKGEPGGPQEEVNPKEQPSPEGSPVPPAPELLKNLPPNPDPIDLPKFVTPDGQRLISESNPALKKLGSLQEDVRKQVWNSLNPPSPGKGGSGNDGGKDSGTDKGPGPGTGATGQRISQRQKRQLRWILEFNTLSGDDYARQLGALGATLAIPEAEDPKVFRVVKDLTRRPVQLGDVQDLSSFKQMYWVDDNPQSIAGLVRALGLPRSPIAMIAFFPEKVEAEMLKLELAYAGRGTREDQIAETRFEVAVRGPKSYSLKVRHQEKAPR